MQVNLKASTILGLVTLMIASTCQAESEDARYFVLEQGAKWVFEMRFRNVGLGKMEGMGDMEMDGEHVQWIDGSDEWNGHQYHRLRSKTTGFENMPDADVLFRVTDDSVLSVDTGKSPFEEFLSLPLPATPGRTWSIDEGVETWHYALESTEPVEVPAGRFEDCIAITTTLESEISEYKISMRREYCAGVGMVLNHSKTTHKHGESNTLYTLLRFNP